MNDLDLESPDFFNDLDDWMEERFDDLNCLYVRGGASVGCDPTEGALVAQEEQEQATNSSTPLTRAARRLERKIARQKARALREAAKVAVDYRPVMSTIIDDYLFRCPSWRFASGVTNMRREEEGRRRERSGEEEGAASKAESQGKDKAGQFKRQANNKGGDSNSSNVYVYRFSQPTHVAGFPACWGLACHTAELPYFFNSMDIIREEYSVRGERGIKEGPVPAEYPYTEAMKAFRGEVGNETNGTNVGGAEKDRKQKKGGKGGVRRSEERSDSKSIIPPSYITNNLPLVASLLASPFVPSLFAIRFAHRRWRSRLTPSTTRWTGYSTSSLGISSLTTLTRSSRRTFRRGGRRSPSLATPTTRVAR